MSLKPIEALKFLHDYGWHMQTFFVWKNCNFFPHSKLWEFMILDEFGNLYHVNKWMNMIQVSCELKFSFDVSEQINQSS
jgi:hypothetical protein